MGTSKSFDGPGAGNPLLPSWLQPVPALDPQELIPVPQLVPGAPLLVPPTIPLPSQMPLTAVPEEVPMDAPMRFTGSRTTLNRIARSHRTARGELKRSLSKYVRKGLRGPRRASARMAGQARTAGRIIALIRDAGRVGFAAAARTFGMEDLSGKTAEEIGQILTEAFLEKGGGIDDGIGNRAWTDTVIDAIENDQLIVGGEGKGRAVKPYGFHSFRHTFKTTLVNAGVEVQTVDVLTGHAKKTVSETYIHRSTDLLRKAIEKMPSFT